MTDLAGELVYEFGDFSLDARRRLLSFRPGKQLIPLPAAAVETLLYLVERAGDMVDKRSLLREIWQDVSVEENSLAQCISVLRRALGDRPSEHRFIFTVPGRGYRFIAQVRKANPARPAPSVAVLPFKALGKADLEDTLQLGMTDSLIRRIGGLRDVDVKPLSSVLRYGRPEQDALEAGRDLNVDIVVDGSVQRSGDRLRVAVCLIDVASGRQLWEDRFDADFADIFVIQDSVAERAATALLNELTPAQRHQLGRHPTENAMAYQAYVAGWSALTRPGADSLKVAFRYLQEAITRDPEFALAHTRLSHCYTLLGIFGVEAPRDMLPKAHASALRALEIDPDLAEAHAQLAHVRGLYYLDSDAVFKGLSRALEINPKLSVAHHYLGMWLLGRGQIDEALSAVRRAQELEPLALIFSANVGMIYYFARRYDDAITQLQATLAMDAGFDHARSFLGRAYLRQGDFQNAIEQFEICRSTTIGSVADLPAAHALAGYREKALAGLKKLLESASERYVSPYDVATVYAALGDTQSSLDTLEGIAELPFVDLDPAFDILRSDPRFQHILARQRLLLNLPADRAAPNLPESRDSRSG